MTQTTVDRYCGTLVGVHVGDSLGAPFERMGPKEIAKTLTAQGGLCFYPYKNPWPKDDNGELLPAGRPTDDSDQTADLAYSLLTCNGFDAEHLRTCLRESVIEGKSRLWLGHATGAGGTTRKALSSNSVERVVALKNTIGTNGSLMRCAPMGLFFGSGLHTLLDTPAGDVARDMVWAMSRVTHAHRHALDACWLYTRVLVSMLDGHTSLASAWSPPSSCSPLETRIRSRLDDPYDHPYDPGAWPARGTAEFSLYVALYALEHSSSFAKGIEMTIRVGGDTDTYATIAGGLLGARYGYSGIPADWSASILGHDTMIQYADTLHEIRQHR